MNAANTKTPQIQSVADICCDGKMVSVLEGGYGMNQCDSSHSRESRGGGAQSSMARYEGFRSMSSGVLLPSEKKGLFCLFFVARI